MNYKDVLELIFDLRGDVWLVWNFQSAVTLALIGWLLKVRKEFQQYQKILASIGYTAFWLTITFSFVKIYYELGLAVQDLTSLAPELAHKFPDGGFLKYIESKNYFHHFWFAFVSVTFMYVFIIYLIWSDKFWKLLQSKKESNNANPTDAKEQRG